MEYLRRKADFAMRHFVFCRGGALDFQRAAAI